MRIKKPMDPIRRMKNESPLWKDLHELAVYSMMNGLAMGRRPTKRMGRPPKPIQPSFPPDEDDIPPPGDSPVRV
jgi:hypothetical protein